MADADDAKEAAPLLPRLGSSTRKKSDEFYIKLAIRGALFVNTLLFGSMVATFIVSRSLAVLASLLDSTLDLMSQGIIWYGYIQSKTEDNKYPVGTARLSPVGILVCSVLMFAGAVQVIYQSASTFVDGLGGTLPVMDFDKRVVCVLIVAVFVKILLLCYSRFHPACARSPDVRAMAQDHFNDILTNTGALSCGYVAFWKKSLWWVDPIGAIVLALYIAYSWYQTGHDNLRKLVGMEADEETIEEVMGVVKAFEREQARLDTLRCYHVGNNVIVEVDIIMPEDLSLVSTHDTVLQLQQELERLPIVERAYVNPDYQQRDRDQHRLTVPTWTECTYGRHKDSGNGWPTLLPSLTASHSKASPSV